MPNRAGQQLGNYRLLRLLGRGGFAEVYLGEHVYLKRRAALKVLHISLEDEDVEHFLAEAQVLARLDHPNIVRVHEFAVEQGTPFLVMDYAPRGTLRQRHSRGSCLSLQTTVSHVKQIAEALQYAHNHQVIHRDVKPENMLLGAQQEVLLSDFGISLLSPSPEQLSTQEMAGTLPYMAPEQIRGHPGFASDQYSLAVIVYEWLCGVRPFEGATWQIAYQQVSLAPAPLREHDPSLPAAVEEVVLKALAKDPRDRYVSVHLFAQALERASQVSRLDLHVDTEVTAPLDAISPASSGTPPVISRRIFLWAAPEDGAFAVRLTSDLQQRGIAVWHDDQEITQNVLEQENVVRQAIRAVDALLLVVAPATPSSRSVRQHLRIASLYQRQLVFVWAAGEDIAAVLPEEWGRPAQVDLVDARNGRYQQALGEIVSCLEAMPVEELALTEPTEELREPRNPYKGLRAFTQHDAADFFGRDVLIAELVERLREAGQPGVPTTRLLAVIGPSGSGKSSVVLAGLLPRLQQGTLPGSERWVYLEPMVPGTHPLETLVLTLAPRFPERSLKAIREDLQDESARGLHLLSTQLVKPPGQHVVLLIDQLEELFTQTTAEAERGHFIDLLITAMTEPQGALVIILTLRADLYDRPMSYPALGRLIVQRQVLVWPMDIHDLRAVIKRPAALPDVQLSFEGNLVGDLLFEVQGQVGALPLLQFTLEQLFERRIGHTLTLQAYQEIGGVKGALAKHAEATFGSLPSGEHRRLAHALFLRLIDPGLTEQDTTRRRAPLAEISLPDAKQTSIVHEVADAFIAARLLTTNEIAGTTTVEVSHEALIREWPRLADWLREGREDIRLLQALSEDSVEWEQRGKPRDRLYRGSQLKDAKTWAARNIASESETTFLHASAARQRRSRLMILTIVLFILLLSIPTGLLVQQWVLQSLPQSVTTLKDNGPGSLRQVILAAKPGSTITFDASLGSGTILLTSGDVLISKNLIIHGPDTGILSISGTHGIHVVLGALVTISNLTFKDSELSSKTIITNDGMLTLVNSTVSGNTLRLDHNSDSYNGFIVNHKGGILTLMNSTVFGNTGVQPTTFNGGGPQISNIPVSGGGGGKGISSIYNNGGTLTLTGSTVSANKRCDGIGNDNNGTLRLSNSTVSDNDSEGLSYSSGTVTINNSMISGNKNDGIASGFNELGAYHSVSTLTLSNSTISDNGRVGISGLGDKITFSNGTISGNKRGGISTSDSPGAVISDSPGAVGTLTLTNSTISGNSSDYGGGGITISGVLQAYISFCTIYGNTAHQNNTNQGASDDGGGILIEKPVTVVMQNSIVAGNHADGNGQDIYGELISHGYNLIQQSTGATIHNDGFGKDTIGFPAKLGHLQKNGGPTPTHALLLGSPAVDQIPLAACDINGITTDQRGMRRPDGKEQFCDIGAYESSS
jgi:tRNA A-37 threonylcarbamoyl transferase component Bud32